LLGFAVLLAILQYWLRQSIDLSAYLIIASGIYIIHREAIQRAQSQDFYLKSPGPRPGTGNLFKYLQHALDVGGKGREGVHLVTQLIGVDAVAHGEREQVDQFFAVVADDVCADDAA
jgi:hypothetical protein